MAKCGLNAESLGPFGLNVVSYHNVEAGSKKRRQELIFWFYAGGEEKGLFNFWDGVLICLFGVCNLGHSRLSGV